MLKCVKLAKVWTPAQVARGRSSQADSNDFISAMIGQLMHRHFKRTTVFAAVMNLK